MEKRATLMYRLSITSTRNSESRKEITNRNPLLLFLLLIIVSSLFSCGKGGKEDSNMEGRQPVPVKVAEVTRRDITRTLDLTGDIEPWQAVEVVPHISGKVAKIYVDAGDTVKKGDILAELDTEAAKLQLKQAEAGLAIAQANYNDAELNWKRMQNLSEKGTVSEQQYEKVKLAYDAAQAQLKQAKAALELAKYQLEVSVMKAPFDGVIASKNLNEGEIINPMMMMQGSKSVVTLIDISKVKIRVSVPDRYIKNISYGLPVYVTVDTYPGKVFQAKIHTISPSANPLSRAFDVEVMVENSNYQLKPGMFARVNIAIEKRENTLSVPIDALVKEGSKTYVFVAENSVARKRRVTTGIREKDWIEVIEGLKENERVITFGKKKLIDGYPIAINGGE